MFNYFRDCLLFSLDIALSVQVGRRKLTRHGLVFFVIFLFLFRIGVSAVDAILDTEKLRFAKRMWTWFFLSPGMIFIAAIDDIVTPRLFRLQIARMRVDSFKANLFEIVRLIAFPIDDVVVLITWVMVLFLARVQNRRRTKFRRQYFRSAKIDDIVIGGILIVMLLNGRKDTRCLMCLFTRLISSR